MCQVNWEPNNIPWESERFHSYDRKKAVKMLSLLCVAISTIELEIKPVNGCLPQLLQWFMSV